MDIESPTQSKKEANKKHGIHRFKNIFKRALKPVSPEKQFALKSRSSGIVDSEGESASEVLRNLKTRSIYVKIISGNGLRAADSNNLSDPVSTIASLTYLPQTATAAMCIERALGV